MFIRVNCLAALSKLVRSLKLKRLVLSSCHFDMIPYLQPDIVICIDSYGSPARILANSNPLDQRTPKIRIDIFEGMPCHYDTAQVLSASKMLEMRPDYRKYNEMDRWSSIQKSICVRPDAAVRAAAEPFSDKFRESFMATGSTLKSHANLGPFIQNLYSREGFAVGVISGPSGCGKSSILATFTASERFSLNPVIIVSDIFSNATQCKLILDIVGLEERCWHLTFNQLSCGEQYRVRLAVALMQPCPASNLIIPIDEFTSTIDRKSAILMTKRIRKHITTCGIRSLVISTCHEDVLLELEPDWVYLPFDDRFFQRFDRSSSRIVAPCPSATSSPAHDKASPQALVNFERPDIHLTVRTFAPQDYYHVISKMWYYFKHHHYLDTSLNTYGTFIFSLQTMRSRYQLMPFNFI